MRLLCGAKLSREDVDAIARGAELKTVVGAAMASSFYALERSLDRRRAFLRGQAVPAGGLTDDDVEQDDLDLDVSETMAEDDRAGFREELAYVEDFLRDLRMLGGDSKLERLMSDVAALFRRRDTLIVFTQYTDTMDYLRDHLRDVYGSQVTCYSGRGGARWDGAGWVPVSKDVLKEASWRSTARSPTETWAGTTPSSCTQARRSTYRMGRGDTAASCSGQTPPTRPSSPSSWRTSRKRTFRSSLSWSRSSTEPAASGVQDRPMAAHRKTSVRTRWWYRSSIANVSPRPTATTAATTSQPRARDATAPRCGPGARRAPGAGD